MRFAKFLIAFPFLAAAFISLAAGSDFIPDVVLPDGRLDEATLAQLLSSDQEPQVNYAERPASQVQTVTPSGKNDKDAPDARTKIFREAFRKDRALSRNEEMSPSVRLAATRNAIAVLALAPELDPDAKTRNALLAHEHELLRLVALVRDTCPNCKGVGTVVVTKPASAKPPKGSIEAVAVANMEAKSKRDCPQCAGLGYVVRHRTEAELDTAIKLGVRDIRSASVGDGRAPENGIFLPLKALSGLLPEESQALADELKRICRKCFGTGGTACRKCGGFGVVPCPNSQFHAPQNIPSSSAIAPGSKVEIEHYMLDSPGTSKAREKCPQCGQEAWAKGVASCPDCSGRGVDPCKTCNGTGHGGF